MSLRAPLLLLIALGALGCGSSASTSTNITAPASTRCAATVSSSASSYAASGGSGTLNINVDRECSWVAASPVGWVALTSSTEGQGPGSVTFRVAENDVPVTRQASITVANRQVPLTQQAAPCTFEVGDLPATVDSKGGEATVDLRTHAACAWTARTEESWVSVVPSSGTGGAELRITITANSQPQPRSVTIMLGDRRLTTTQAPALPTAPTPTPVPTPPAPVPTPTPPAPVPTPTPPTPTPTPTPPAPVPTPTPPAPTPTPTPPAPTPTPTPPAPTPVPTPPAPTPGPTPVKEVGLKGDVKKLGGECPTVHFAIGKETVLTTAATAYSSKGCGDLREKIKVRVKGWLMSDGNVRADRIEFDDDDDG